jgi:guanylate kinase
VSRSSLLLLVSGPAGTGKTTLCDRLLNDFEPELQRVITSTTRTPRDGEVDGVDYHFFNEPEFQKKLGNGEFYEHAHVHSGYYGTLKSEIQGKLTQDTDLLLNIDVQGAASFREIARVDPVLGGQLVTVFIQPVSIQQIHERLEGRGKDSAGEINRRLLTAQREMSHRDHFNHVINSGSKEEDYLSFRSIYEAERGS